MDGHLVEGIVFFTNTFLVCRRLGVLMTMMLKVPPYMLPINNEFKPLHKFGLLCSSYFDCVDPWN